MNKRIEYIDNIKGFAILLVVMGHVIANWYSDSDLELLLENDVFKDLLVWKLIYSFHMPLFMFCSGLFQPVICNNSIWRDVWNVIVRRFKVLMVPYFVSGLLLWAVTGRPSFYWFLLILFEFILINLVVSFIASRFGKIVNYLEGILFLIFYLIIYVVTSRLKRYEMLPLLDIGHLNLYLYFTFGYLVSKYKLLVYFMSNIGYTLALLLFVFLYVLFCIMEIKPTIGGFLITPLRAFAAIYATFFLFRNIDSNRCTNVLNYLGCHSLEIYILHFFFLLNVPFLGDYIHKLALVGGGIMLFVMGICASLLMAAVNISFCFGAWIIISKSKLLSQLLLGRKYTI